MKTIQLGQSSIQCSRIGYGCWRLAGVADAAAVTPDREERGRAAVLAAFDAGYTLFDNADVYCDGAAETIFGQALKEARGMRDKIVIETKCGIRKSGEPDSQAPYRYDFSAEHIVRSCEGSLQRMGIETIDLYVLHRPDALCDPAEVASAFAQLRDAGKAREFGVSNFRPSQVQMLARACPMPLAVNQVEISLFQLAALDDGTLDQCLAEKITPQAWSPLAGGRLGAAATVNMKDPHHARKQRLYDTLDAMARERGSTRPILALAWLLRHPAGIAPIIGSINPERIAEMVRADEIELTREEWYRLYEAALGQRLP